jgi:ketosteroid isomerase-like protein
MNFSREEEYQNAPKKNEALRETISVTVARRSSAMLVLSESSRGGREAEADGEGCHDGRNHESSDRRVEKMKRGVTSITADDLAGAKDLGQRFVDSINRKDLDGTMACVWNSPKMLWVSFGTVIWGYDGFRNGMKQMFDGNETVKIAVTEISYVPIGNVILAVGTATIDLQPKGGGAAQHIVERWTDVERKVDGRWVYVLDHTTMVPK